MLGSGKGVLGVVRISWNEGGAGPFPDREVGSLIWVVGGNWLVDGKGSVRSNIPQLQQGGGAG